MGCREVVDQDTLISYMSGGLGFFFFQAEDGIRDYKVTGVQTCALPISWREISGNGLPALRGIVSIAAGTGAQRVYVIGDFGLYRSDDGGATWRQMAAEDRKSGVEGKSGDLGGRRIIKKKKKKNTGEQKR